MYEIVSSIFKDVKKNVNEQLTKHKNKKEKLGAEKEIFQKHVME